MDNKVSKAEIIDIVDKSKAEIIEIVDEKVKVLVAAAVTDKFNEVNGLKDKPMADTETEAQHDEDPQVNRDNVATNQQPYRTPHHRPPHTPTTAPHRGVEQEGTPYSLIVSQNGPRPLDDVNGPRPLDDVVENLDNSMTTETTGHNSRWNLTDRAGRQTKREQQNADSADDNVHGNDNNGNNNYDNNYGGSYGNDNNRGRSYGNGYDDSNRHHGQPDNNYDRQRGTPGYTQGRHQAPPSTPRHIAVLTSNLNQQEESWLKGHDGTVTDGVQLLSDEICILLGVDPAAVAKLIQRHSKTRSILQMTSQSYKEPSGPQLTKALSMLDTLSTLTSTDPVDFVEWMKNWVKNYKSMALFSLRITHSSLPMVVLAVVPLA